MQVLTHQGFLGEEGRLSTRYAPGEGADLENLCDWLLILCEALLESL